MIDVETDQSERAAPPRYRDRREVGRLLSVFLEPYSGSEEALVLAIPRGGVPVAVEIARKLALPLDVLVVQKIGVSLRYAWQRATAAGAIAEGGVRVLNPDVIGGLRLTPRDVEASVALARVECERREAAYRGTSPFPMVRGRTVILVDDGIETGATIRVAIQTLRIHEASRIVVAVPLCRASTCKEIAGLVDEIVCPLHLSAGDPIHSCYDDFPKVHDAEALAMLEVSRERELTQAASLGAGR